MVLFLSIPKNNFLSVIPKYCRLPYGIRTCAIFLLLNMGGSCDIVEVFRVKKDRPRYAPWSIIKIPINAFMPLWVLCAARVFISDFTVRFELKKQQRRHTKLDAGTAADVLYS